MLEVLRNNVKQQYLAKFEQNPVWQSVAPGRINVIGEHTDYNFGLSMPAAINRWVIICFGYREDHKIQIFAENYDSEMHYEIGTEFVPDQSWKKFIYGALEIFQIDNKIQKGFNAYIWGNVPLGAGVSSSAAIEVAMMALLRKAYNSPMDDLALVKNCQQIEHQYLGVKCGLLDQYASQFSKAGMLMALDFQKLTHRYFKADLGAYSWVLINTKVKRELASSKYSERVTETQSALEHLRKLKSEIKHFRDIVMADVALISNPILQKRIKHYLTENQRVLDTATAFANNDIQKVGNLLSESHYSLKNDYQVSCDELDYLISEAEKSKSFAGGRMMGGGFGGCTINLVKTADISDFVESIKASYKEKFNITAEHYVFEMVDGANVLAV